MSDDDSSEVKFLSAEDMKKADDLLKACQECMKELEEKLSKVLDRKRLSIDGLKKYYSLKENFSPEKWADLQKEKARFDEEFKAFKSIKSIKQKSTSSVKKKPKKLGNRARQRLNWLSMD